MDHPAPGKAVQFPEAIGPDLYFCDVYREGDTLLTAGYNESVCFATAHGYTMPTAWENALAKAWQVKFPGRAFRLDGAGTNFPSSPLRRWEALHAMGYLG
jgi:hypothetical protein